jgi:hypothetical protein
MEALAGRVVEITGWVPRLLKNWRSPLLS